MARTVSASSDPLREPEGLLLLEPGGDGVPALARVERPSDALPRAWVLPLLDCPEWLEPRIAKLLAGDMNGLEIAPTVGERERTPRWAREPRAREHLLAWTPAHEAALFEAGHGERRDRGAFYTGPAEVELAVRLALAELLRRRGVTAPVTAWTLGQEVDLGADADVVCRTLGDLSILDPACGAGAFLVGALLVVEDLLARLDAREKIRDVRVTGVDVNAEALEHVRSRVARITGVEPTLHHADALLMNLPEHALVVGNPPYVRQERIADPLGGRSADDYKKLLRKTARERGADVPARADLYVHFLHRALDALASEGVTAQVVSASWLDLAYARELRERLSREDALLQVHESSTTRSFASADVNTVILVAGRGAASEPARFVRWRTSFESGVAPEALATAITDSTPRDDETLVVAPRLHADLDPHVGWGGAILRAPGIYTRHADHPALVPVGELAEVRFGLKTGANSFFYVDARRARELELPTHALRPILTSARECPGWRTSGASTRRHVLWLAHDRRPRGALARYLAHAEEEGLHRRPSVSGRAPWWSLGTRDPAPILLPRRIGERFRVFENDAGLLEDNNLFGILPKPGVDPELLLAALNCTWSRLSLELASRPLTGAQPLVDTNVYLVKALRVPNLQAAPATTQDRAREAWRAMCQRSSLGIPAEYDAEDRHALDEVTLQLLDAKPHAVTDLHTATIDIVSHRLTKAPTRTA